MFSTDVLALNPELHTSDHAKVTHRNQLPRSEFDSQLEADYCTELKARELTVVVHGLTFNLPGGVKYTPDLIAWDSSARVFVIEVKGDLHQKNARDSQTRFRIAAGLYAGSPLTFIWVTRRKNGEWHEQPYVKPFERE
jgi:hypothetical protein